MSDSAYTPAVKKHLREIMETGVICCVGSISHHQVIQSQTIEELMTLSEDNLTATITPYALGALMLRSISDEKERFIVVNCVGGMIAYSLGKSPKGYKAALRQMVKGNAMRGPQIDTDSIPHRFQQTRFRAMVTLSADGSMGTKEFTEAKKASFKWFDEQLAETHYKPVIIGRKTFEEMGGAKALPGRMIFVFTHDKTYKAEGAFVTYGPEHFLSECLSQFESVARVYILGGAHTFKAFENLISSLAIRRTSLWVGDAIKDHHTFIDIQPNDWFSHRAMTLHASDKAATGYGDVTVISQNYMHRRLAGTLVDKHFNKK